MSGFVVPPYPHDRLGALQRLAVSHPMGLLDLSIGTPNDPLPEIVASALRNAVESESNGYPTALGSVGLRNAVLGYLHRRFGVAVDPEGVMACVGTKELVASLPHVLHLRDPERKTVLYPAVSYPTYAMGALLAGLNPVAVPLDSQWHMDVEAIAPVDAADALVLWLNEPSNPTGASMSREQLERTVRWAQDRGIVVASDECYVEFTEMAEEFGADPDAKVPAPVDRGGSTGLTVLTGDTSGVLAVHSLSKRSNAAGLRSGFVAGDPELVKYLVSVRKHAGMMMPGPIQAASAVAWSDDMHVNTQRDRYRERRETVLRQLGPLGLIHDGGRDTFYLWLRTDAAADDGWEITARFAEAGILVAPGDMYGPAGADHAACPRGRSRPAC